MVSLQRGFTSDTSPVLVTFCATLLVILISLLVAQRRQKRIPPGPFPWPVLGNLPVLSGGLLHHVLRTLGDKYGGLMYLQLGSVPTIVVSTVEVSKELFQTRDTVFLDRPKMMAFDILNEGCKNVAVANGRYWRDLRKLLSAEIFSAKRLASYKTAREEEIHNMMKGLVKDNKQGRVVDLKNWLFGATCNNITRMLTNKRYYGDGADSQKEKDDFMNVMDRTLELCGSFIVSDFVPYLAFVTRLQGVHKKLEEVRDDIADVADRMMDIEKHRREAREREQRGDEGGYVPDMVDVLLRAPLDNGQVLPDKYLTLNLTDLLTAGTETSAGTVEFAMAELMRQPESMQLLQDELRRVIGPDRVPEESDIPNLPFLLAVVKEVFRLHPPAAINIPRESNQPFEFRGFQFPKQTRLMLNFYAIHRDPSVYEFPDEFKPERFLQRPEVNHLAAFESFELTPFSAGRRMCPGADLGNTVVCLLLAHLVHSFDWTLPNGEHSVDMTERFGLTVSLKAPLRLVAKPKPTALLY